LVAEKWSETMTGVAKLQEHDVDLKTSKPFSEINDFIRTRGYEEASKIFPKKDIENFDKICNVIKETYNVDAEGNIDFSAAPRYKSMKSAYYDILDSKGQLDAFLNKVKNQGAREGREQVIKAINNRENLAQALPIGGGQAADIVNEVTDVDIDRKLAEYSKPEYDMRLRTDVAFQKENYDLLMRKAEKDPSWRSAIPAAWITKFEKR
jgi:hypothetical protein